MADPQTQETPAATGARASEGQGWGGWLSDKFTSAALWTGSWFSNDVEIQRQQNAARMSDTPGTDMLVGLSKTPMFESGAGKAQLDAIRNDPQFMASLNKALVSDRSILKRMAEAGGQDGNIDANGMMQQLADPKNRALMTQVLNKIGEDANDGFGATYLSQVTNAAQTENYSDLNQLLQQGGISDSRVAMGATMQGLGLDVGEMSNDPLGAVSGFLTDPTKRQGAIRNWINNPNSPFSSLDEGNKNMVAGLVEMLAKFAGMYMGPGGFAAEYIAFGKRLGGELSANGAGVRGVANLPSAPTPDGGSAGADLVGSSGNPRSGTSLASAFNPGGLNQRGPALEPDAGTPAPQVQRVEHRERGMSAGGVALG
jgi:hypothetical protein